MRFSKSLLMMFAGLGLFACNNNDDIVEGNQFDGPVDVAVKINLPGAMTRSIDTPSGGEHNSTLPVEISSIKVTLLAGSGEQTATLSKDDYDNNKPVEFKDVENPTKVFVKVNYDGEYSFDFTKANTDNKSLKAPMYGESLAKDFVENDGTLTTTVKVEHKLARLEIGGIKHVHADQKECMFTDKLVIAGSFLQGVKTASVESWDDFYGNDIWSKIELPFTENTEFPTAEVDVKKCFAYNVDGTADSTPIFTLAFSEVEYDPDYAEAEGGAIWGETNGYGYAVVKTYKVNADKLSKDQLAAFGVTDADPKGYVAISKFPAGYIYRITSLDVPDSAIKTTMTGDGVDVIATVEILDWTVVDGEIEWK